MEKQILYKSFIKNLVYPPTECQDKLFRSIADFLTGDDADIFVVNGYAGTGKTTAMASVVSTMNQTGINCVLLAPTGRSAKILASYTGKPAYTVHKHIYKQKSVSDEGFGLFSMARNESQNTLFVVDEVSLIGIEGESSNSFAAFGTGNLLEDLIKFVRAGADCRLIMIGDAAQLPPVGLDASPALSPDYMNNFGGVMYAEMTTVVRQKQDSGILYNATLLRKIISQGENIDGNLELFLNPEKFNDIERVDGAELSDKLSQAYSTYGEDETIVLCRSNKRANRYNAGIRSSIQYKEELLVRGDKLMIVKNCYQFVTENKNLNYIANGDIANLLHIGSETERYGLHFAKARLEFQDYDNTEIEAIICLDTLASESPALTYEQQNALYQGVNEDYAHITSKKKRYDAIKSDPYFNALQIKYANAITCHKSQGGQWQCVFIDNPFWQEELITDDFKWLYTALTRAVKKIYFVNLKDRFFKK